MRRKQLVVNYKGRSDFEYLNTIGTVTYSSKVLNMLFMDTDKSLDYVLKLDGVTHAYEPEWRLYRNKR